MENYPLCKDCKHCHRFLGSLITASCEAPQNKSFNPVTGEPIYRVSKYAQIVRGPFSNCCGLRGEWFTPRVEKQGFLSRLKFYLSPLLRMPK